jgi:hypothetical protein
MNSDGRVRLWRLVVEQARGKPVTVADVCSTTLSETGLDRASVSVTVKVGARETLYASDRFAADLAELALTLGEGPSLEASAGGPVLIPDLGSTNSRARWPAFSSAAVAMGVGATFALPLRVGAIRLGVIDLYRGQPGRLSQEQVASALVLADTACTLLIDSVDGGFLGADGAMPEQIRLQHPEVHQATGMIIAQLGVTAAVALIRLRAYSYANDRRLRDVARDVVARRLRFEPDQGGDTG